MSAIYPYNTVNTTLDRDFRGEVTIDGLRVIAEAWNKNDCVLWRVSVIGAISPGVNGSININDDPYMSGEQVFLDEGELPATYCIITDQSSSLIVCGSITITDSQLNFTIGDATVVGSFYNSYTFLVCIRPTEIQFS